MAVKRALTADDTGKAILKTAWPDIPTTHRPDFVAMRKIGNISPVERTRRREAFLWPHINLEDLSKDQSPPLFLNARGRRRPDKFTWSELQTAHIKLDGHEEDNEMSKWSMVFMNQYTPMQYGRLIRSFLCEGKRAETPIDHLMFNPGVGLLILEIQVS